MLFFLKMFAMICFLCNISFIQISCAEKSISYPSKVTKWDGSILQFDTKEFKTSHYYNPVDEEWKREKCRSLGFTFNEPITEQKFTSFMIPVDSFFNNDGMYYILSEVVCGSQKIRHQLQRNIIQNLMENQDIKQLFGDELFNDYIKNTIKISDPVEPDRRESCEACPICYENSTIILETCNHAICQECTDKLKIKKQYNCPLCRSQIEKFIDINGEVQSKCGCIELFAAAYYLDVCIYVYDNIQKYWLVYRKDWPNYDNLDMKDEKCIYLYVTENRFGIVHNVIE
ncbi:uncharacterized protein LOC126894681 isoform X1 [Daktulosphaira vitifoliae]|uniref:uncharacterized protein LOC126894681 isoform X1 n=1 Tax=Daktulosphaira vitifoliae TaxID=58002 RepID=UPI0021A98941|nr:uncharacterized protein LOC126894681 isoform X1 [Daktulosphaira vitifoliae]